MSRAERLVCVCVCMWCRKAEMGSEEEEGWWRKSAKSPAAAAPAHNVNFAELEGTKVPKKVQVRVPRFCSLPLAAEAAAMM